MQLLHGLGPSLYRAIKRKTKKSKAISAGVLEDSNIRSFFERTHDAWFFLTNKRLIQRDGKKKEYQEVLLDQITDIKKEGRWTAKLTFTMKNGTSILFEKVDAFPVINHLQYVMSHLN